MATITADLGGTRIKLGILENGRLLATAKVDALPDDSIEVNLERISREIRLLLKRHTIPESALQGIGLTFPGIVDSHSCRVLSRFVKYSNASEFDFKEWARREWGLPIALENDARAALLGEWKRGAGRGADNMVLLTLGTGVGSAVLMGGRLLKGAHFLAGNLGGHMSVKVDGQPCTCGFFGCLETEASSWVLPEKARKHPLYPSSSLSAVSKITFAQVFEGAASGDALSEHLVHDCLRAWGVGVVNMVHAFDPDVVIIGGGVMEQKEMILPYLQQMVDTHSWAPGGSVKIVSAEQVEYAGLLGMDYLILNQKQYDIEKI